MRYQLLILLLFCNLLDYAQQKKMYLYFGSGSDTLSAKEKARLDSLVYTFHAELEYKIRISGNTDSIGTFAANKLLSERRARTVQKYLSANKRIISFSQKGNAFLQPVQTNQTEEGRARNRRCELYIDSVMTKPERWEIPVQAFSFKNNYKNILHTKNGCKVIIEPGSFTVSNSDTVRILITEYNDPADYIAGGLPMSYSSGGKTHMYQSEQMMKIEAFVDSIPVKLVKLMGLECPDIDTSRGVKFYEFRAEQDNQFHVFPKLISGTVEEIKIELAQPEKEKVEQRKETEEKKEETKVTEEEKAKIDEEQKPAEEERTLQEKKKETTQRSERAKERFKLKPDTGRGFELEPDTGRGFVLPPDTARASFDFYERFTRRAGGQEICGTLLYCDISICDTVQWKPFVDFGLQFKNQQFEMPGNFDIRSYYARYRDLSYDGMSLKCLKKQEDLYKVRAKFRKRFLHKDLVLKIKSFPGNPEYAPLRSTRWILHYGAQKNSAKKIRTMKISDFRILRSDRYYGELDTDFFVELKSDSAFYGFAATPKRSGRTWKRYTRYEREYARRVIDFEDSIINDLYKYRLKELFCLYNLTAILSNSSIGICHYSGKPACYPFSFFGGKVSKPLHCARLDDCLKKNNGRRCWEDCFPDWIRYYNLHMAELQGQLEDLKKNPKQVWNCECWTPGNDDYEMEYDPCYKWRYDPSKSLGNTILYIGLGIYNFDREMALEKKQYISDAVYLSEQGDTLLKCEKSFLKRRKVCHHVAMTVIPDFKGLLKQNRPEKLILLPGKENILYFTSAYNRRYKLYLDLRNVEEYKGRTFILKDITEKTRTLDGLREELTKTD